MAASQNPNPSLEDQLEALRSVESIHSAQFILKGIKQRVRWRQRQVIAAIFGAGVAAVGVVFFALQAHPFAFITLTLTTAAFIYLAWKSARNAASLAALKSGNSLLSAWRAELEQQLHHTLIAQLFALLFLALTVAQVWRDGLVNLKSLSFIAVATVICTFAAYQYLVQRPSLHRELQGLKENA